jgi:hypothetical protein
MAEKDENPNKSYTDILKEIKKLKGMKKKFSKINPEDTYPSILVRRHKKSLLGKKPPLPWEIYFDDLKKRKSTN